MQLVKKLSSASILGNINVIVKAMEIGATQLAYSVVGICSGYEQGVSQFGQWTRFTGDLQATNYLTEDVLRAPKAHIPDVLETVLLSGVAGNTEDGVTDGKGITSFKLKESIEFAYKVSIERKEDNEDGSISYEYRTEPLTEIAASDNLSHLTKLLDAPKKETKEELKTEAKANKAKAK